MSNLPTFTAAPKNGAAALSTAVTATTGLTATTTNVASVLTTGANGSLIKRVTVIGTGTVAAGLVRLFLWDGTTAWLWQEIAVTAVTPSTSVAQFRAVLPSLSLVLPTGYQLLATTTITQALNVIAEFENY